MNLKNKILLNKFLIPAILLIVLLIYILKQGIYILKYDYGVFIFDFILWLFISIVIVYNSTNHLIKYTIESDFIRLTYFVGLKSKKEVIIPLNGIKFTKLQTRIFEFGFDVLSIKYVDDKGLYNLLDLRISNKKDWIDILSKIEIEVNKEKTTGNTV